MKKLGQGNSNNELELEQPYNFFELFIRYIKKDKYFLDQFQE